MREPTNYETDFNEDITMIFGSYIAGACSGDTLKRKGSMSEHTQVKTYPSQNVLT